MSDIRRKEFDITSLRLSAEEGFVLSRLDVPLAVGDLVALTGMAETRIEAIVQVLETLGVVERDARGEDSDPRGFQESHDPHESPRQDAHPLDDDKDTKRARGSLHAYETLYRPMTRAMRIAAGKIVTGDQLLALCHDPEPQVIDAILSNPRIGLDHARHIARHHRTASGLDHVGRRGLILRDLHVERNLLANPQLSDSLLRKVLGPKRLADQYTIALSREIPERTRLLTRELMQKKFLQATPDERAALIVTTDGRCLVVLVNCALDARTTQLLVSKRSYSALFVQNFARWSATPPALLAHLLRLPLVRQNIGLKKALLNHRNVPPEAKRSLS